MKILLTIFAIAVLIIVAGSVIMLLQTPTGVPTVNTPPTASSTPTLVQSATFLCQNNRTITADFYTNPASTTSTPNEPSVPSGSVTLKLSDGRVLALPQTISADGARYALPNDTLVFWNKGNGVLVYENNVEADYRGCVLMHQSTTLPAAYVDMDATFTLALPSLGTTSSTYTVVDTHSTQVAGGRVAKGVKFIIPVDQATGTNLSNDSYLSVETLETTDCTAAAFLDTAASSTIVTENDTSYSKASTTGAGAGNRYQEIVYALPGTNPCLAIRYFIHTTAYENYPAGSVKNFDVAALISTFDSVRRTLVINQ